MKLEKEKTELPKSSLKDRYYFSSLHEIRRKTNPHNNFTSNFHASLGNP